MKKVQIAKGIRPALTAIALTILVSMVLAGTAYAEEGRERPERGIRAFFNVKFADIHAFGAAHVNKSHANGTVESVSTTDGTLVVVSKKATTTVAVSASTSITIRGGETASLADIDVGNHVQVKGEFDDDENMLNAATIVLLGERTERSEEAKREHVLKLIARLEAFIAELKVRLGL